MNGTIRRSLTGYANRYLRDNNRLHTEHSAGVLPENACLSCPVNLERYPAKDASMKARLQFSLPVLLMVVTITCFALAVWFQPRSVTVIARDVYRTDFNGRRNDRINFEADTESLRPLLAKLPAPVPSDLREYLNHCIPDSCIFIYGAGIDVHDLQELLTEHTEAVPCINVLPHGFFCFARDGGGAQFAFCIHDSRIYQFDGSAGSGNGTVQSIKSEALNRWGSLREFLLHAEQRQKEFHCQPQSRDNKTMNRSGGFLRFWDEESNPATRLS